MINATLQPANRCIQCIFVFALFFNGCTSSPTYEPVNSGRTNPQVWLQLMFRDGSAAFTPSEGSALRALLKGIATKHAPSGSPTPRLKYEVRISSGNEIQTYYFMDDGSLMLASVPAQTANDIRRLICRVAARIQ